MTHLPCIHSPELGFWTGNTPLGSPDFPFTRFYVPIVDVVLDIDFSSWLMQPRSQNGTFQKDAFGVY